mmetsp:Transcript_2067/g.2367  ORF Transcript_2067/g.2367 Transcript_2067/m.2367 type:complete len:190 (+) Transcript_2067:2-571(+)
MKADYTSLTPKRNYWLPIILLGVLVGVAYYSCSSIYRTSNNSHGINAVINAPVAATTSLVRDGDGNGNGGQEDFFSTSVGNGYIESETNSFVEEKEGGLGVDCNNGACVLHRGDEKACNGEERRGCYWYPRLSFGIGYCASCSGVNCGVHRAPECSDCPYYDGRHKEKGYCNGACRWHVDDNGGYCEPK